MSKFYFLLEASSWQINFQDPATPIAAKIIEIHHHVFFFLTMTLIFVVYLLKQVLLHFHKGVSDKIYIKKLNNNQIKIFLEEITYWLKLGHNTTIEIIWTCIPSFILILIAIPSFCLLYAMDDVIDPQITIKVIGNQWYWSYDYMNYLDNSKDIQFDSYMLPITDLKLGFLRLLEVDHSLIIPNGVTVRMNITSSDVLHCWAVPALGIKIDAVPQRLNSGVIFAQRTGTFYGQCSEICGVNHGFMPIVVKIVSLENFNNVLLENLNT